LNKIHNFAVVLTKKHRVMPLFLGFLLCYLSVCAPPDWANLKRALIAYELAYIHPVWQAQQTRLHKALSAQEHETLSKIRTEHTQMQIALAQWQKQPTNTADRDKILKKIQQARFALAPIQEKHTALLVTFAKERDKLKDKWKADMAQIIADYNAKIDNTMYPYFAKYSLGSYDDDEDFLLWKQTKEEGAAGGNQD